MPGIVQGKNAGVGGGFVGVLMSGLGTQLPWSFEVVEKSGAITYPNIIRTGRGTDAAGTVAIGGGAVTSGAIVTPGFGYNAASASISGGGGTGATATITLVAGAATAINVTAGGSGYTAIPMIAITESAGQTPVTKLGDPQGSGELTVKYQFTGVPMPNLPKYATGTIRYVMQTTGPQSTPVDYIDCPVRFTSIAWEDAEAKTDVWTGHATWELAGNPVLMWQGQQVTISPPSSNDKQTYESLAKTYDPQFIETSATVRIDCETVGNNNAVEVAKLASVAASLLTPMPQLQIVTIGMTRTESNGLALVAQFGPNNTAQKIYFPASRSVRSAQEPYIDVIQGIFACASTDTLSALADTNWATFQSSPNAWSVEVERVTPYLYKLTYTYRNSGLLVFERTFGESIAVMVRDKPTSPGTPQVFIADQISRGSGTYWYRLGTGRINQVIRRFMLTRQYTGNVIKDFVAQENTTNNATFLGLSAGTVLYEGAMAETNIALSNNFPISMTYMYRYTSNAYYTVANWYEWIKGTVDLSGSVGAWLDVTGSEGTGLIITSPAQSNFGNMTGTLP